jgi:predicted RNA-binding protein YlxR (DUF448 family)
MTRGGREKDRDDPERKCIATGESQPKAGLIRFCLGPDGQIVPDILGKLPGRGIYVSADREAMDKAAKKNLFSRAARQPVKVPDGLADLVEQLLVRQGGRTAQHGAQGGRRGHRLREGEGLAGQGHGGDADPGQRRVGTGQDQAARARRRNGASSAVLSAGEIGLAFGRERAIHAALAAGGLRTRVVEEAAKLAGLRGQRAGGRG